MVPANFKNKYLVTLKIAAIRRIMEKNCQNQLFEEYGCSFTTIIFHTIHSILSDLKRV